MAIAMSASEDRLSSRHTNSVWTSCVVLSGIVQATSSFHPLEAATIHEGVLHSSQGTLVELKKSLMSLYALWGIVEDRPEQSQEPLIGTQLLLSSLPEGRSPLQRRTVSREMTMATFDLLVVEASV